MELSVEDLEYHKVPSMYDDVSNGTELTTSFTCPHCKSYHRDVTIFKRTWM